MTVIPLLGPVGKETIMTIQEIERACRLVRDTSVSDRIRVAMSAAIVYLDPDMPARTMRWVVAMLRDLADYADQYDDDDCADWLYDAANALRDHITEG